ncbi:M23 family metallopeptidase [Tenacibaculum geojense]|uniref:M23 family metallopeptidase n=1 Tax=Tenacibaculum geojense TaxID=915352 RepID=A0ABW3JTV6_9FLAO
MVLKFWIYHTTNRKIQWENISFSILHLIKFKEEKFRFCNDYKSKTFRNKGWLNYSSLGSVFSDPYNNETYKISFDGIFLEIDNNIIDVELAKNISKGKKVKKGDIIGYTGSTGNALQPKDNNHLHFGIRNQDRARISPYEMFKEYVNLDASGVETNKKQDGKTPSNQW